jgi:hypothetical protein
MRLSCTMRCSVNKKISIFALLFCFTAKPKHGIRQGKAGSSPPKNKQWNSGCQNVLFLICLLPYFYVNSSAQIYVIGYEESIPDSLGNYTSIAKLWKNGELLPTYYNAGYVETGKAVDIAVVDNDIYVLTTQNNSAFVWKNEDLIYELPHDLPNIYATAMFIPKCPLEHN